MAEEDIESMSGAKILACLLVIAVAVAVALVAAPIVGMYSRIKFRRGK